MDARHYFSSFIRLIGFSFKEQKQPLSVSSSFACRILARPTRKLHGVFVCVSFLLPSERGSKSCESCWGGATSLRKRTKYLFPHVISIFHPKFSSGWDPSCFTRLFYFSSINFLQGGILFLYFHCLVYSAGLLTKSVLVGIARNGRR